MKPACLILILLVAGCAAATDSGAQQVSTRENTAEGRRQAGPAETVKRHVGGTPSIPLPSRSGASPQNRFHGSVGEGNSLRQLASRGRQVTPRNLRNEELASASRSEATAKHVSLPNKSATSTLAVRRTSPFPSASSSLDTVRHRGVNPAIVGRIENTRDTTTGGIDGNRMSHKP